MPLVIEPLERRHQRIAFDCGDPALNEYLRLYARQNQERGLGRTYVAVREGERRVVGYYTLAAGSVEFSTVPERLRCRFPRYPIPVAHLCRLATCQTVQGQGLGEALLFDALLRTMDVAEDLGIVALEVWAKGESARAFYLKYGFEPMLDDGLHLYLPLATAQRLMSE